MLEELYNNPALIISIVIFLVCVIIGFVGDLYLKKVKKEEEAKQKAENTKISNEEQIETLDTEPIVETIDNDVYEQPVNNSFDQAMINNSFVQPIVNNSFEQPMTPVDINTNSFEQPMTPVDINTNYNVPFGEPAIEQAQSSTGYEVPIMESVNNVMVDTPVDNNFQNVNTAFEQPIMPTNINSDYNVSMSYEEPVQSFSGYETPFVEPINNTGMEMQNINNSEFNSYNTMSNDFATPTVDYVQPVQNLDETQILDPMNNYAYEVPNTNTFNQTNDFTDNNLNNSDNNNLF